MYVLSTLAYACSCLLLKNLERLLNSRLTDTKVPDLSLFHSNFARLATSLFLTSNITSSYQNNKTKVHGGFSTNAFFTSIICVVRSKDTHTLKARRAMHCRARLAMYHL